MLAVVIEPEKLPAAVIEEEAAASEMGTLDEAADTDD